MSEFRPPAPRYISAITDVMKWLELAYRWIGEVDGYAASGSFTGTLTGFSGADPTGTIYYEVYKNIVVLSVRTVISGTSDAVTMTMTGLPAAVTPSGDRAAIARLQDNSTTRVYGMATVDSGGVITFRLGPHTSASYDFTNSGTKGLGTCEMVYTL